MKDSHMFGESQKLNASHQSHESHVRRASHYANESQSLIASHYEIRQLIENYYDIQKMRVEAFNRIVSWIKENSHIIFESHVRDASHFKNESQKNYASQLESESHVIHASQSKNESHAFIASLIKNKKYSKIAEMICRKKIKTPKELKNLVWFYNQLFDTEKGLYKRLDEWSRDFRIREEYLSGIYGIGPVLTSGIVAWLMPISRFDRVSRLWSYAGLSPTQKREKGKKLNYNPRLKTFCWKVWNSFIKIKKSKYREYYLKFKEDAKKKHSDWTKMHIHNYAGRKTVKLFLSHLWEVWRRTEGLDVTKPYAITILGHEHLIKPFTDKPIYKEVI